MTDLLFRIDAKLTKSIPLLMKLSLIKYVLVSVLPSIDTNKEITADMSEYSALGGV